MAELHSIPATGPHKPLYDDKHKAALDYQRSYATAKRAIGRRKVSKEAFKRKQRDAAQRALPITDTLSWRNRERDPERTELMEREEANVARQCRALEIAAAQDDAPAADATAAYIVGLTELLHEHLRSAKQTQETLHECPTVLNRAMHAHRRIIAGIHQEIELNRQGMRAVIRTGVENGFILEGCRVKKRPFHALYGF
ncbi:hypothetical protein FA95DRAFT_1613905 [Auriscalpium vulgare]|uniref:Uncharacterized protein n=1 Tax=Auriscalpium vulgare TaxID=40419 RepID=A0ACB8R2B2_9AGAM|nr:hypothetical protein FA95DRAFT_1613905 [Auriscalpium vulgare]